MAKNPYQKITQKATKTTSYTKTIKKTQTNNPYLKFIQATQSATPFQDIIKKAQKNNTYTERVKQSQRWYERKKRAAGRKTGQTETEQSTPEDQNTTLESEDVKPGEEGAKAREATQEDITKQPNIPKEEPKQSGEQEDPTKDILPPSYPTPGWMFSFSYDPKHAETLEYYDTFPLILVVSSTPTDFIGINFHYLSPMDRAMFLDALQKYTTWDDDTNALTINISYSILMAKTELAYYKPCLKMYLSSHVVGNVSSILPTEWDIAMFLPSEQFKKETKEQVWLESRFKMGNF